MNERSICHLSAIILDENKSLKYIVDNINKANLFSYIVLEGTRILCLIVKGCEERYNEEKLRLVEDLAKDFTPKDLNYIQDLIDRWADALVSNGYSVKVCDIETVSRTVISTGDVFGRVPFEVGLSFAPILNVPFIPSSTLKGAFRHSLEMLLESNRQPENIAKVIFGSQNAVGVVGVTDAYPISLNSSGRLFEPDVVTPHYPGVRDEFEVSPNPIIFPTIATGVKFRFFIFFNREVYSGINRRITPVKDGDLGSTPVEDVLSYAIHYGSDLAKVLLSRKVEIASSMIPWVDRAVLYAFARGVGAKTSLGYSRFNVIRYAMWERG